MSYILHRLHPRRKDRMQVGRRIFERGTMGIVQTMLRNNRAWAAARIAEDPKYFSRLARLHAPEVLWIGCSDSRVAANVITGTLPGTIFVHRNIANQVVPTDLNLLSVLEYGVRVLGVKDIIVCGHYGCGGIRSALARRSFGAIDPWLKGIKDVYRLHRDELSRLPAGRARESRLTELSVLEQVHQLATTSVIQETWRRERRPTLHGWAYGLETGHLIQLVTVKPSRMVDPIYQLAPHPTDTATKGGGLPPRLQRKRSRRASGGPRR